MPLSLPESATCLNCGYSLRGLTEPRCPECGVPFRPESPSTFRWGPPSAPWYARSRVYLAIVTAVTVVAVSFPDKGGTSSLAGPLLFFRLHHFWTGIVIGMALLSMVVSVIIKPHPATAVICLAGLLAWIAVGEFVRLIILV
jgi:hypothetical protein